MLYSQRSDLDKITDLALNKVRRFFLSANQELDNFDLTFYR